MTGCTKEKPNNEKIDVPEDNQKPIPEEKYIDDNPIKLGIYKANGNYNGKKLIKDTYYATFTSMQDIESFEVFFTDDEIIYGSNFKTTWHNYYDKYDEDISKYRIGYNFKFTLNDGTDYAATLLEPDIYYFSEYFYIYFYDDVNAPDGQIYSHLENVNDETIISSVKLFAVGKINDVQNITLTAFSYDSEEDFDKDGNYRGNSSYTITIKNQS